MPSIITPEDIVSHLLGVEGKPVAFRPWSNRWQKWLLVFAVLCLVLGAVLVVAHRFFPFDSVRWAALGALALSQVVAAVYPLAMVLPSLRIFRDPTKTIADPVSMHFNAGIQAVSDLADTYAQHHLDYARDRLAQVVEQLRYRVGFMIGAVEKVGILPSSVAGYLSARELLQKPELASSGIEWAMAAYVAFYIAAMVFMLAAQRVEHLAPVAKHAAVKKRRDMSAKSGKAAA